MDRGLSHKQLRRLADASVNDVLLHWLGRDHCASQVLLRRRKPSTPAPDAWDQFRSGNVLGIGLGAKETAGKPAGDIAVRIYVRTKQARSKLSASDRVPPTINGLATDVIDTGTPTFHARPVPNGMGISHVNGLLGTLGCVVTKPGDNARYILSACHVLAPEGAKAGDEIVEPAMRNLASDPRNPNATRIGILTDFEPLRSDGTANRFDVAIAKLDQVGDVLPKIPLLDGAPRGPVMPPVLFQSVFKYGAGTGRSLGVVMSVSAPFTMHFNLKSYVFDGVIEVAGADGAFSTGGDSGGLVVDALSGRPIGLIIGGFGARTFLSPIRPVLDRFGADLLMHEGIA